MQRIQLGQTKVSVSRLIYGTEPFNFKKGPDGERSQGDKSPIEAAEILRDALKLGVNTWDTSDDYGTHPHVAAALELVKRKEVVIADKSNSLSEKDGLEALEFSKKSLGTDYIDIMFLHIVPSEPAYRKDAIGRSYYSGTLCDRFGALKAWNAAKETGEIKATALSTHSTKVLRQVLDIPEIDVVCTTLNIHGDFMDDGTLDERIEAIRQLKEDGRGIYVIKKEDGRGIYVIKLLSAGRLKDMGDEAIEWCLQFNDFIDAWNIGMYNVAEVKHNMELFKRLL
jgi:aryl-alcohol dehydrogenase-like predicted oxidoreductase